jgi:hypothetical protein
MTDWADEIAKELYTMYDADIAAALREARNAALEDVLKLVDGDALDAPPWQIEELIAAIRALKTTETGNKTS